MEARLALRGQEVQFDRDATQSLYREIIPRPGADECTCFYCKNFAAQRSIAYPDEFLGLLDRLGIDPFKEWEVFDHDYGRSQPGWRIYGGWFLFCGELILDSKEKWDEQPFSFHFTRSFPACTPQPGIKVCALQFVTSVPWTLPESPD